MMHKLNIFLVLLALATGGACAADGAEDVALRLTTMSVRRDVAANDPRVGQARALLDKAVQMTGEKAMAVAAACSRYAGHLFDAVHEPATPLELLEALVTYGKAGKPMNETLRDYAAARKSAPGKSHAEAMAGLGKKH